jgi:hypothetical protein
MLSRLIPATAIVVLSCAANAGLIRVSQESAVGAGDFDANVLGSIDAFSSLLTASQYYAYNTNFPTSFDDGGQDVTLTSNMSHSFFVSGSDGLSAFIVHDKPSDGGGGSAGMTLDLVGDTASVLVKDDAIGDVFSGNGTTNFVSTNSWFGCCTDGFVIGALDGLGWSLFAEFDSRAFRRDEFAGWMAFDGSTSIALTNDLNRRVRFDIASDGGPGPGPDVPVPSTILLFGLGLAGLGWSRRKKV